MQEKIIHYILGLVLIGIAGYVAQAVFYPDTQADEVVIQTLVENIGPSVDSVFISNEQYGLSDDYSGGTITGLNGGSTKEIHINGIVSDLNNEEDINQVVVVFYRTNHISAQNCEADDNDCYKNDTNTTCLMDTSYGSSTQVKFDCQFDLTYFIDATDASSDNNSTTDWTVYVKVIDDDGAFDIDVSVIKEIQTLLSLNIPASISFGTMTLGANTVIADNQTMTIEQFGNGSADVEVSGTDLICDGSTAFIPLGNIEWSLTDVDYGSGTDLTGTPADTNLNVAVRTDTTSTEKIYWNIKVPTSGVKGNCTGSTTITTIAH
ncbi:MAG: hypothetical protein ABIH67_03485 [Candidatus Uhrbacteria bacterium]